MLFLKFNGSDFYGFYHDNRVMKEWGLFGIVSHKWKTVIMSTEMAREIRTKRGDYQAIKKVCEKLTHVEPLEPYAEKSTTKLIYHHGKIKNE